MPLPVLPATWKRTSTSRVWARNWSAKLSPPAGFFNANGKAEGDDDVLVLVDERLDVGRVLRLVRRHVCLRFGSTDRVCPALRTFPAVLVEVAVVEGADVGHDADLQIARPAGGDGGRCGRGVVADDPAQALANVDLCAAAGGQHQRRGNKGCDKAMPSLNPHLYLLHQGVKLPCPRSREPVARSAMGCPGASLQHHSGWERNGLKVLCGSTTVGSTTVSSRPYGARD